MVLDVTDSGSESFSVSDGRLMPLLMLSSRIVNLRSDGHGPEEYMSDNSRSNLTPHSMDLCADSKSGVDPEVSQNEVRTPIT